MAQRLLFTDLQALVNVLFPITLSEWLRFSLCMRLQSHLITDHIYIWWSVIWSMTRSTDERYTPTQVSRLTRLNNIKHSKTSWIMQFNAYGMETIQKRFRLMSFYSTTYSRSFPSLRRRCENLQHHPHVPTMGEIRGVKVAGGLVLTTFKKRYSE